MKNLKLWTYSVLLLSLWNVALSCACDDDIRLNVEVLTQAREVLEDIHALQREIRQTRRNYENTKFGSIARENMLLHWELDNQQDLKVLQRTTSVSWSTLFSSVKEFVLVSGIFGITCYLATLIQKGPRLSFLGGW